LPRETACAGVSSDDAILMHVLLLLLVVVSLLVLMRRGIGADRNATTAGQRQRRASCSVALAVVFMLLPGIEEDLIVWFGGRVGHCASVWTAADVLCVEPRGGVGHLTRLLSLVAARRSLARFCILQAVVGDACVACVSHVKPMAQILNSVDSRTLADSLNGTRFNHRVCPPSQSAGASERASDALGRPPASIIIIIIIIITQLLAPTSNHQPWPRSPPPSSSSP